MVNASSGSFGVSSLVSAGTQSTFDVRKESDVINLLRLVHLNPIDPEIKNHLRDLIFTYRQTLANEDGEKIRQSLLSLGVTVVYTDENGHIEQATPPVRKSLGNTRPQPHFIHTQKVEASAPVIAAPEIVVPPVQHAPQVQEVVPSAPEVVVPVASASPTVSLEQVGERIKEIKRIVNEKVGNPVNLIDAHNEIGREYMNALLDAMKKSNGAGSGELHLAMDRLELAFKHVQEVIFAKTDLPHTEEQTPAPSAPVKEAIEPPKVVEVPHIEPVATLARSEEEHEIPLSVSSEIRLPQRPRMSSVKENIAVAAVPPLSVPEESENALHSVAKEKQLQDLLRSNRQKEIQTKELQEEARIAQMDPLFAPDVTSGLNQLLSEWGLFKSSGIFGTGPSGKDHPLYKKLSTLTMAAVIAGRFEGATAPIKQSITDYMNGWRYEEGVVHDHGETFEHYLRRVVRHILSRKQLK